MRNLKTSNNSGLKCTGRTMQKLDVEETARMLSKSANRDSITSFNTYSFIAYDHQALALDYMQQRYIMWKEWSIVLLSSILVWPRLARGDCTLACKSLLELLPNNVFLPTSPQYASQQQYWSLQQGEVSPACRVAPSSASDVSQIVKKLRGEECPFTVKGGGHTPFAGGSNIQAGITIDFEKMASVSLSTDFKSALIGPGTRWLNAYQYLDPLNLTVLGGRVSDVGVSGLTLGGGISFFSARYGFVCDNVDEFEIVLASGEITDYKPLSQCGSILCTPWRWLEQFWNRNPLHLGHVWTGKSLGRL
ncbi:hypothetical protein GJ744_002709 [Endocarpon pusillum]|uniref:FAD-binding PCMH-type domain-containing protein n=1 Tax=Endocarpon pusillum TaxID=364733 RepID=A0A8H7ARR9_9EURO|nr:hypothetical protein GJ744_002709 [Endocarpon pusillum]